MYRPTAAGQPRDDEDIDRDDGGRRGHEDRTDTGDDEEVGLQGSHKNCEHRADGAQHENRVDAPPPGDSIDQVLHRVDGLIQVAVIERELVDGKQDEGKRGHPEQRERNEMVHKRA